MMDELSLHEGVQEQLAALANLIQRAENERASAVTFLFRYREEERRFRMSDHRAAYEVLTGLGGFLRHASDTVRGLQHDTWRPADV